MSWNQMLRQHPVWALTAVVILGLCLDSIAARPVDAGAFSIVGAESWDNLPGLSAEVLVKEGPRVSVLETDAWRHSLADGRLVPVPQLPFPSSRGSTDLLPKAYFTPAAYLEQIETLRRTYCRQRDVLMYYGGIRYRPNREGLNFNAWSGADLKKLRLLGSRPFIGLETMDRAAVRSMIWRLKEAGYGSLNRIYVRIGSEPSTSAYGTEDGTRTGRRRTPAAYAAYNDRFARTAAYLSAMNRRLGLNLHAVFAGTSREDFNHYAPSANLIDAIGYDLYITPENKSAVLQQIRELTRRYPDKPLVIPEFGIATEGQRHAGFGMRNAEYGNLIKNNHIPNSEFRTPHSNPYWAADTLGDVLMALGRHPAGVGEITVFSVNVSGRRKDRRWSWAWTPQMYEMLREWQASPRTWKIAGFHRYDPLSYPVGRDVLFLNRPDIKIVYRKLSTETAPGVPMFQETCLYYQAKKKLTTRQIKIVYFEGSEIRVIR